MLYCLGKKILHSSLFILHFFLSLQMIGLEMLLMEQQILSGGALQILSVNNSISYLFSVS